MNYRIIEVKTESQVTLKLISKWHNLTPKLWIPEYKITEEDILSSINDMTNTPSKNLFVAVAENDYKEIRGFIWGKRQEADNNSVMILSLYVENESRNLGIASGLKHELEKWCKKECIDTIETTVHYTNEKMIELNKKLGYTPKMVRMIKKING